MFRNDNLKKSMEKDVSACRKVIESLRIGTVPYDYVSNFFFDRENEVDYLRNWLYYQDEGVLIVFGENGSGKTHFLEYIYRLALKENWAVSLVKIDPVETPLNKAIIIYQKLISSFRYKDGDHDFRKFLTEIANLITDAKIREYCSHDGFRVIECSEDGNLIYCPLYDTRIREEAQLCHKCEYYYGNREGKYEIVNHEYLGKVVNTLIKGKILGNLWEWIEGSPISHLSPPFHGSSECANIYCYILSAIGWAARNILGMNGFLILFDQTENISDASHGYNLEMNLINGLILMVNNDERLLRDELEPCSSASLRGRETNLLYCKHFPKSYVWKIPCHVKIVFAFSNHSMIQDREPFSHMRKLELRKINDEALYQLAFKIISLYENANGFQADTEVYNFIINRIRHDNPRLFIKGLIEALDLIRYNPAKSLEEIFDVNERIS